MEIQAGKLANGDYSNLIRGFEPSMPWDVAGWIASLHSSLMLDEILRECGYILAKQVHLRRLSLVQRRGNESIVTIYSVDLESSSVMSGPKIEALEPSRLKDCINRRSGCVGINLLICPPDKTEQRHFMQAQTTSLLYLPVSTEEHHKGTLVLGLDQAAPLTAELKSFLNSVSKHLTLALEHSDTHYRERRRSRQLSMVSEIANQAVKLENLNEFLQKASELLRNGFDYETVQIWIFGVKQELILRGYASKSFAQADADEIPSAMVCECLAHNQILCNNNLAENSPATDKRAGIASQLVLPISLRGKLIGILSLESGRLDAFQDEDLSTMEGLASLIAAAFENLRTFAHAQQSNQYMQAIMESSRDGVILSTDRHGYVLTSSVGSKLIFGLSHQEIIGRDILSLFSEPRFHKEMAAFISSAEDANLERTRLMQSAEGTNLYIDATVQRVCNAEERPVGFLCIIRNVTQNVMLQRNLEELSITDELTGLYNQRHFFGMLAEERERSRRFHRTFSLCFFDLDGFKSFNDSQGHLRGDDALKEASELMRSLVRANVDTCFRYGGDEFTIIMPETTAQNALMVVERIRAGLCEHFQGDITASIGIAEFSSAMKPDELVYKADRAMYVAKSRGGNRIVLAA